MRSLLIFGNGLGMSLDPSAYSLHRAMHTVWESAALTSAQKQLILACLPRKAKSPSDEAHLGRLQSVVAACEKLLEVAPLDGKHWLNDDGQEFPKAVQRFAFEVARCIFLARYTDPKSELYGVKCQLPLYFTEPLSSFIRKSRSHIATLNYDGLLSQALEKHGLLNCDTSILRDGFAGRIFNRKNLFRPKEQGGWYLHLHGCPLFSTVYKNRHRKISELSLEANSSGMKHVGQSIVLTNAESKPDIIKASGILDVYWEFLELSIHESRNLTVFGYSGNDIHLNRLIAQNRADKPIRVVEYLGAGRRENRLRFWSEQFGDQVDLVQKEDVMTFQDWGA